MNRGKIHRGIFAASLMLLAFGLPFSEFLLSVSQMIISANWIAEGRFRQKWDRLKNNKLAWILLSFYLLHVAGLLWTQDFSYAMKDLRTKAPVFILTLILATSEAPCRKVFRCILATFAAAVFLSTVYCFLVYRGFTGKEIIDIREISVFISNIRLSLMVCLSVAVLYFFFMYDETFQQSGRRYLLLLPALWFLYFLYLLESVTGIAILGILSFFIVHNLFRNIRRKMLRAIPLILLALTLIAAFLFLKKQAAEFGKQREPDTFVPRSFSPGGEIYYQVFSNKEKENGYFIYRNIAWRELERCWQRKSKIPFSGLDRNKQYLRYTLLRFMTSKGLKKDSVGFSRLSDEEITAIENGTANVFYLAHPGLKSRIHSLFWEYNHYRLTGNPSGHSATMRVEFLKNGWEIFKRNPIIGVGTGDINQAFREQYEHSRSQLEPRWRLKTHNEYLTMAILFGIPGFLLFLLIMIYPILTKKHFLYIPFFLILLISMLTEDTLETQTGVTFYAFFSTLLTFSALNDLKVAVQKNKNEEN